MNPKMMEPKDNSLNPDTPDTIVSLSSYELGLPGSGSDLGCIDFSLSPGDVCAIEAPNPDDGLMLLKALATLVRPSKGGYTFLGRIHDLANYREALSCKQKIGYAARDATLISNLSVRQNLLLMRYYFEDNLNIVLHPEVVDLCRVFGIIDKLDLKPWDLSAMENRAALLIRELAKRPALFLFDQPEDFLGQAGYDALLGIFRQLINQRTPIAFLSYDQRLTGQFANRRITIADGALAEAAINTPITGDLSDI
jgi:ABC-type lipoprotein export system ATPase subunit